VDIRSALWTAMKQVGIKVFFSVSGGGTTLAFTACPFERLHVDFDETTKPSSEYVASVSAERIRDGCRIEFVCAACFLLMQSVFGEYSASFLA
jgi:hypothetical protein